MTWDYDKLAKIDSTAFGPRVDGILQGFIAVRISSVCPGSLVPCDIFLPIVRESENVLLEVIVAREHPLEMELKSSLLSKGIEEVYIREENEDAFLSFLSQGARVALRSLSVATEEKARILYGNAETIVRKAFRERLTPATVRMGREFVENFVAHMEIDKVTVDGLYSLFSKDYGIPAHSVQVALLGMCFCRFLGWPREEISEFGLGGLLHDIGKSSIDSAILNKPGSLSKLEFEIVKKHTVLGYQQLKSTRSLTEHQLSVALSHHEALDGSGYPLGLEGEAIHKYARLARIIDCFDALTTRRPYKEAVSPSKALQVMKNEMGSTFDPFLFDAFSDFLRAEKSAKGNTRVKRINIKLESQLMLQFKGEDLRMKATLVGMESGEYIIVRVPLLLQAQKFLREGASLVVRYINSGTVCGFKSTILGTITSPSRLLFISYPRVIETVNLRKEPRAECFIPALAEIYGKMYSGVVVDLSVGGCRFMVKHAGGRNIPALQMDDKVTIHARMSGEDETRPLFGKVRNMDQDEDRSYIGVEFVDLSRDTRDNLIKSVDHYLTLG